MNNERQLINNANNSQYMKENEPTMPLTPMTTPTLNSLPPQERAGEPVLRTAFAPGRAGPLLGALQPRRGLQEPQVLPRGNRPRGE